MVAVSAAAGATDVVAGLRAAGFAAGALAALGPLLVLILPRRALVTSSE